jgi:drug/metabolite transporter (DMT)-like permease
MNNKYFTKKSYVALFAVLCSILCGSAFPVLKLSYGELNIQTTDTMGRLVFAGMRFLIASIIIFIVYKFVIKKPLLISKKNSVNALKLGLLQTVFFYSFFYIGIANTTGVKASILDAGCTFFVILIEL